ncbi:MAG: hypothetical protein Q4F00_00325 [bacterium]|nr:hypothetical protein [bacterium]
MDPISALGDERRRLVENTQRSNSALHTQSVKRHKDRMKKGHVDSSYYTDEADDAYDGDFFNEDEEDLDSGGGGSADLFRQMWEDDVEANQPAPMAGDTIFEEGESSGLLGGEADVGRYEAPLATAYPESSYPDEECQAVSEWHEGEAQEVRTAADLPSDGAEVGERSAGSLGVSARYTERENEQLQAQLNRGSADTVVSDEADKAGAARADGEASGGAARQETAEKDKDSEGPALEHISMGEAMAEIFGGLDFMLGAGNEAVPLETRSDLIQIISTQTPTDSIPRAELPPVSEDIGQVLNKLIIGNKQSPYFERLRSFLSRFGKGVLSFCLARETRIHLVPGGQLKGVDILRGVSNAEAVSGLYTPANRTCYVDERALAETPYGVNPVIFFMAQAWDHALGEEDFASLHSPAVLANFDACRTNMEGHSFADELCALSPVYYFAQSVEAYLAENDCYSELWNREDLYDLDRSMYDYVEYLFKQGNR